MFRRSPVPRETLDTHPLNVAQMYQDFARALFEDRPGQLDFDHGVMRHEQLVTVERAAASGTRRPFLQGWGCGELMASPPFVSR